MEFSYSVCFFMFLYVSCWKSDTLIIWNCLKEHGCCICVLWGCGELPVCGCSWPVLAATGEISLLASPLLAEHQNVCGTFWGKVIHVSMNNGKLSFVIIIFFFNHLSVCLLGDALSIFLAGSGSSVHQGGETRKLMLHLNLAYFSKQGLSRI